MEEQMKVITDLLLKLNVNEYTEKKNGLTYLSWAFAWQKALEVDPNATYVILKNEMGLPYFGTPSMGYMIYTSITINGLTREMWLPVMDGANKSLRDESYEYSTKYGKKSVEAINMFDVNKTIMRCLVKNLAMFGLGLYIYAGEDLPEDDDSKTDNKEKPKSEKPKTNQKNTTQKSNNEKPKPTTKPQSNDELKNAISKIDALAREKVAIDKEAVIKVVSDNNDKNPDYKKVKTLESANKIIDGLTKIVKKEK